MFWPGIAILFCGFAVSFFVGFNLHSSDLRKCPPVIDWLRLSFSGFAMVSCFVVSPIMFTSSGYGTVGSVENTLEENRMYFVLSQTESKYSPRRYIVNLQPSTGELYSVYVDEPLRGEVEGVFRIGKKLVEPSRITHPEDSPAEMKFY